MAAASDATVRVLRDIVDYLKDTETDIEEAAAQRSLRDTDKLVLSATHNLFVQSMRSIEATELPSPFAIATFRDASWDCEEERYYRYIVRCCNIILPYVVCFSRIWCPNKDLAIDKLFKHLFRAQDMCERLLESLKSPVSYSWPCRFQNGKRTAHYCSNHFHTTDGLIWPLHEAKTERDLTELELPDITFRDFKYMILPGDNPGAHSIVSARKAVQRAQESKQGRVPHPGPISYGHLKVINEASTNRAKLPEALAVIGMEIQTAFARNDTNFHLGIILPGGSEIFWPQMPKSQNARLSAVFIKAYENLADRMTTYKFQPVEVLSKIKGEEVTQTMHFVDLPPVVRNMIYTNILADEDIHAQPHRQPAVMLTCRQVNKDVVALLLRKWKWFVSK